MQYEIVYLIVGILAGAAIGWLYAKQKANTEMSELRSATIHAVAREKAREEAFVRDEEKMLATFKNTATDALSNALEAADKEKEGAFKTATDGLSNSLLNYSTALNTIEQGRIDRESALRTKISNISDLGMRLSDDTQNLTRALKGDSQVQGAWGEVVVENILQRMGFVKGRDYYKQLSETASDGSRKVADFVVNLPDERQIVIDSKVSLTAYTEFVKAEDEEERQAAMKRHCDSIRSHAKKLASKNYHHMEKINSLDIVLMVPALDSAFIDAMRYNPDLYAELAVGGKVRVVTGGTLEVVLFLIKDMWQREKQSENQIELINRAGKLYDKVVLFLESFTTVGFELRQATDAFDQAENQLKRGKGNVIRQTEMLRELGAKTQKDLREKSGVRKLAEEAEEEEVESLPDKTSTDGEE
jgi:DNA recombination protein RmuC